MHGDIESHIADPSPDNTPVTLYTVKVSQRDYDHLQSLKARNYGGFLAAPDDAVAIVKIINQINDNEDLDNYDSEGTCPTCRSAEIEDID
jgi:hypothetical protein